MSQIMKTHPMHIFTLWSVAMHRIRFDTFLYTYNADSLSNSVTWQILAEAGTHGTGATVQSCYFAPDGAYTRLNVWLLWHGLACLCFEYINTTFADIELSMFLFTGTINLKSESKLKNHINFTQVEKFGFDSFLEVGRSLCATFAHNNGNLTFKRA